MRIPRPAPALAATLLAFFAALPAHAVSNRIFMSSNGNNANDCANPLTPCLTFAGALAQVNPGGEVIAEATGGYGALNITQAVTISGPPGVVIYSGLSVTVNAPGATVVLRGLTIDGTGSAANGIDVASVGVLHVESCVITGFTTPGPSTLGNGIYFNSSGRLYLKDTVSRQNGNDGALVLGGRASIEHCRFEGNGLDGVLVDGAGVAIRDSEAAGNVSYGFIAQSLGSESTFLSVFQSVGTGNGNGFFTFNGGSANQVVGRIANSSFSENISWGVIQGTNTTIESLGNNFVRGNLSGNVLGTPLDVVAGQ